MQTPLDHLDRSQVQAQLLQATYACIGADYVHSLTERLAQQLQAAQVLVTRAIDFPVSRVQTVAASQHPAPSTFALAGTPCAMVYQGQVVSIASDLAQRFPNLAPYDSFHGYPLLDIHGHCFGHLALFFTAPTPLPAWLQAILSTLASRLGAELQRMEQQTRLEAAEHQLALQNQVLRLTTAHAPLQQVLDTLLRGIEAEHPGALCSLMAPDPSGTRLHLLAAPSLPAEYLALIEGIEIGPQVGSCGAAAYSRQRVIASDLQTHPNWQPFRQITQQFQLGSCWSQPLLSGDQLLGAFAIYHREPRQPGIDDFAMIDQVSDLTCQVLLHHDAMQALRQKSEHYQLLLKHGADGTVVLDRNGHFLEISEGFLKQIGAKQPEDIMATQIWDWSASLDQAKILKMLRSHRGQPLIFQTTMRHLDGSLWDAEITTTAVDIDGQSFIWASARDITERKKLEAALLREARLDSLTGIANRGNFMHALEKEVARARRYPQALSVLMLDLDHFKQINDQYGHSTGDDVLRILCRESAPLLRKEDLMGRLGGEEFAVMLPHTSHDQALEVAQRLLASILDMAIPLPEGRGQLHFSCSIGVASLQPSDAGHETLLSRADKALYRAKAAGRGQVADL